MKTRTAVPYYSYWIRRTKAFIAAEGDQTFVEGGGGGWDQLVSVGLFLVSLRITC